MQTLLRLLPGLAIAQAVGILLADRGWLRTEVALLVAAHALVLGFAVLRSPRARALLGVIVAGCAGAAGLGIRLEAARFAPAGGVLEATLEGRVAETRSSPERVWIELEQVRNADPAGASLPARIRIQGPPTPALLPALESYREGARIRARVRLKPPRTFSNPGGWNRTRWLARRGVGAVGYLVHPALHVELKPSNRSAVRASFDRARLQASEGLRRAGPGGGLLAALATGDRSALSTAERDALAELGISHLIAVSGLHLTLIAALSYAVSGFVVRRLGSFAERSDPRRLAVLCALASASAYALFSGWGTPVRRALVFLIAVAIGFLRRRPGPRKHPLALAAMLVLAFEPSALFEPGPQMSFAASAAILASLGGSFHPSRSTSAGRRLRGYIDALLRSSSAAIAATAPLAAVHFGQVSPFGMFVNLIAIPLTGTFLLPASLLASLATLSSPLAPAAIARAVSAIARPADAALRGAERLAGWLPDPPAVAPLSPSTWLLALITTVLVVLLRRTLSKAVVTTVGVLLLLQRPAPPIQPFPPRVVLLDVGQGDAVLVQGKEAAVLVDAATASPSGADLGRLVVVPALAALGVERLDLVIASHADLDHRGGLPAVIERFPTARLWLPVGASDEPDLALLREIAAARGIEVFERGEGDEPVRLGDLLVAPLWPSRDPSLSRNDASLVVRIDVAGSRVLLPGDIGARAELALVSSGADLSADVLKLPHHGSRTSTSLGLLRAVSPSVAIASAPCPGRFGMPHRQVLERAARSGIPVWWTGRDGAVLVGLARDPFAIGWAPTLQARPGCESRAGGPR